jgi:arylsulfatase A-like enzyme
MPRLDSLYQPALAAILLTVVLVEQSQSVLAAEGRPNIVLIVADDLGWADIGIQGGKDIPTPHIDSIAHNGVRFTNAYVSCPVCSPTRAGLMTGRYQQRFGHEFNTGPRKADDPGIGLPVTETTIAERLKKLGYTTGLVGKWHLGFRPELQPTRRGFDEFYGFLGGFHSYLSTQEGPDDPIMRGTKTVPQEGYLTDTLANEAVDFIDRHRSQPFFLCVTFNAVHAPLIATDEYLERLSNIENRRRRIFGAMLLALDDAVGDVLEAVEKAKQSERTLIIFLSDNGGLTKATSSNAPLRGQKGQTLEGGIRVPFLMQWNGKLPAGKLYDEPVVALDILPTLVAAAGGKIEAGWKVDGVDLLPYVTGENTGPPHASLCWRYGPEWAIRAGDWKLVNSAGANVPQLINLEDDVAESRDLSAEQPAKVRSLLAEYRKWESQMTAPRWPHP